WTDFSQLAPDQLAMLAARLMNLGEMQRAESVIRQLGSSQMDVHAMLTLAQIMERTNRVAEAERLIEHLSHDSRAASLGTDLFLTQAQLAQRRGDHERACELFQRALQGVEHFHDRH